jgi:hypothetical protein
MELDEKSMMPDSAGRPVAAAFIGEALEYRWPGLDMFGKNDPCQSVSKF